MVVAVVIIFVVVMVSAWSVLWLPSSSLSSLLLVASVVVRVAFVLHHLVLTHHAVEICAPTDQAALQQTAVTAGPSQLKSSSSIIVESRSTFNWVWELVHALQCR